MKFKRNLNFKLGNNQTFSVPNDEVWKAVVIFMDATINGERFQNAFNVSGDHYGAISGGLLIPGGATFQTKSGCTFIGVAFTTD